MGALNPDGPPARCTVCGKVLAPLLVENGYTAHPTCSEQAAS